MNNEKMSLLFSLRCRTVINVKGNFSTMYDGQVQCQLGCTTEETQEHLFECPVITQNKKQNSIVKYAHIFGDPEQQVVITREFNLLLEEREALLQQPAAESLPVGSLDPDVAMF